MSPGWRITTERACAGRNAPTWPAAAISSPGRLFLGERGVRFDPYVGLGGRPFLAGLINDFARRIGLRCLFAHLCQEAVKRGEHLSVVESDGASLAGRFGVRLAFEIRSGLQDLRASVWSPPGAGGLPGGGGDRERAREVTTRTAMVPCVGLGFVNFCDRLPEGFTVVRQARFRTIQARPKDRRPGPDRLLGA